MSRILIIDDEPALCWGLSEAAASVGHVAVTAASVEQAREKLSTLIPDAIVLDVRLPGQDGLSALADFQHRCPGVPLIVMTAFGDLPTATRAFSGGAFEYLVKPFELQTFLAVLSRALAPPPADHPPAQILPQQGPIVGSSPAMQAVYRQIALVAPTPFPVLLLGETGTGKELAARAVHEHSAVASGPFIPVCPASLNPTLIESELFGHVKGAFTGADDHRRGLFEAAAGGTLFLDEIADTPLSVQVKLLRVLESRRFSPVGSGSERSTTARFIAATHRNLPELIAKGQFREDLYHRLTAFTIGLPPLRERSGDLPLLVQAFLAQLPDNVRPGYVSPEFLQALTCRTWTGNVRELRNAVEHAVVLCRGGKLLPEHLPRAIFTEQSPEPPPPASVRTALSQWLDQQLQEHPEDLYARATRLLDSLLIPEVLARTEGNRTAAARLLGMDRATLRNRLKESDLSGDGE